MAPKARYNRICQLLASHPDMSIDELAAHLALPAHIVSMDLRVICGLLAY